MSRLRIFPGVSATQCVYVYTKVCTSVHNYIHRYASRSPAMIYEYTHVVEKDAARPVLPEPAISGGDPPRVRKGFFGGPYRGMQCGK